MGRINTIFLSMTTNYIMLYLGYQLIEADMINEFPDLKFIEKKIVHYVLADLLFELKKYVRIISFM